MGLFRRKRLQILEENVREHIHYQLGVLQREPKTIFKDVMNCKEDIYTSEHFRYMVDILPPMSKKMKKNVSRMKPTCLADELYILLSCVDQLKDKIVMMRLKQQLRLTIEPIIEILGDLSKAIYEVFRCQKFFDACRYFENRLKTYFEKDFSGIYLYHYASTHTYDGRPLLDLVVQDIRTEKPKIAEFVNEIENTDLGLNFTTFEDYEKLVDDLLSQLLILNKGFRSIGKHPQLQDEQFNKIMKNSIIKYEMQIGMIQQTLAMLKADYAVICQLLKFSPNVIQVNTFFDGLNKFILAFKSSCYRVGVNVEKPMPAKRMVLARSR
ncbi:hypothetical protein CHUAL_010124 [Chamberlinius hualienensis]